MDEKTDMEITSVCRRCGYAVNPSAAEKFCGYCGSRLESLDLRLRGADDFEEPLYIDQKEPIVLNFVLKNRGIVDIDEIGMMRIS